MRSAWAWWARHFENSSGLPSPQHYTTARDLSLLAIAMIREYPQYYKCYSVREFEHNGIKQQNRNGLLEKDPSVDGLKTGHTDSAGFCLVTSSLRNGMRLVSVVHGFDQHEGARECQRRALELRIHVLRHQARRSRAAPRWPPRGCGRRQSPSVDLGIKDDLYMTLPRGAAGRQDRHRRAAAADRAASPRTRMSAPCACSPATRRWRRKPLHPLKAVAAGGWWRRLIDTIRLWFAK